MKRILSLILVLCLMLSLAACAGEPEETTAPTVEKIKTNVAEPLTQEAIDAIPLATDSMTEEELRQIVLDFMHLQLTFGWTPSKEVVYSNGTREKVFTPGVVYGGIPYISSTFGNIYTAVQYLDPDNGVMDLSKGNGIIRQFANQCSSSTFWAWTRVCNTLKYGGTADGNEKFGCLRVGPYTYDDTLPNFINYPTAKVCQDNGAEVMFESYAALKAADGIVNYSSAGHVRMVSSAPTVVKDSKGAIDGAKSYITYYDQQTGWNEQMQSNGIPYEVEGGINVKVSFIQLYNDGYLPFTLAELNKKNPVEKSETSFSFSGDSATAADLNKAKVTSNYPISDLTVTVKDAKGKVVYTKTMPNYMGGLPKTYEPAVMTHVANTNDLGAFADGKHTVEVSARISTGEKPVVYTGTLTK